MTTSALVVEDDPHVMDDIEDTLFSIGHRHVWVTNQQDARAALRSQAFQYVLLDLQIPARANRGGASKEYGINLLREIRRLKDADEMPVVIMTAYCADCLDLSAGLMASGASEFISKPFEGKPHSLAKVIRKVLRGSDAGCRVAESRKPAKVEPFSGGELVFHSTRVELCGVKLCGDAKTSRIRSILDELNSRTPRGHYVAFSGQELADRVGCRLRGQNAIAEAIRSFRKHVAEVMLEEASIQVGQRDVIQSGGRGYRFADKIVARDASDLESDPVSGSVRDPEQPATDPAKVPIVTDLNNRQQWILTQLRSGHSLRIADVMAQFACSKTTAKRDLSELRRHGLIVFAGAPRTGIWEIPNPR